MIDFLLRNLEFIKIYIIPLGFFVVDILLRIFLKMDIIDAGVDMALLSFTTFVSLIIDDKIINTKGMMTLSIFFSIASFVIWLFCLGVVSIQPITLKFLSFLDLRIIITWIFGFVAFLSSGIVTNMIIIKDR